MPSKSKKTKLGKGRLDKFYHLAKEQGYRSRASFKLIQLNKKYDLLSKSKVCLDLCAAPGSWAQVCAKNMPNQSLILAIDLVPMKPIPRVICLQEDITTDKCRSAIKSHIKTWKVDLVLNDGAPNVGANWSKDAYTQSELTLHALKLATQFLTAGGTFVTKVFRSQDYNSLMWVLNQLFKRVEATKPQASRNQSAEIFVVCLDYLAPSKIDPKLLDPKHIFEELELNPAKKANVLQQKKLDVRHRDGYEAGVTLLYKEISAKDFVLHEDPLTVLSEYNKIVLGSSEEDAVANQHDKTTEEVRACLKDLRVLGKREFRGLLRWKDAILETIRPKKKAEEEEEEEEEKEEGKGEDGVESELAALSKAAQAREKRRKRKEREKKAKQQRRLDLKMDNVVEGDVLTTQEEIGLFSLNQAKKVAKRKADSDEEDEDGDETELYDRVAEGGDEEVSEEEEEEEEDSDVDEEEARRVRMEEELDELYDKYCERRGVDAHRRKKRKKGAAEEAELDGFVPDMTADIEDMLDDAAQRPPTDDEEEGGGAEEAGGMEEGKLAEQWFSQPIFSEVAWQGGGGGGAETGKGEKGKQGGGKESSQMVPAAPKAKAASKVEGGAGAGAKRGRGEEEGAGGKKKEEAEGFEEVAASDSESDLDSDGEGEVAAMGALLLKKKMRKEELIDACYHRWAFNDGNQAPGWFQTEEKKFNKPQLPITKEMMQEEKRKLLEIAARPIKKVMEAKARKKLKAVRAVQKQSSKAEAIGNDSDLDERAKMRALQKLYDKGVAVKRPRAVAVVAKKGGKSVGGKGVKIVDRRMKKDMNAKVRTGNRNFKGGKKTSKKKVEAQLRASAPKKGPSRRRK